VRLLCCGLSCHSGPPSLPLIVICGFGSVGCAGVALLVPWCALLAVHVTAMVCLPNAFQADAVYPASLFMFLLCSDSDATSRLALLLALFQCDALARLLSTPNLIVLSTVHAEYAAADANAERDQQQQQQQQQQRSSPSAAHAQGRAAAAAETAEMGCTTSCWHECKIHSTYRSRSPAAAVVFRLSIQLLFAFVLFQHSLIIGYVRHSPAPAIYASVALPSHSLMCDAYVQTVHDIGGRVKQFVRSVGAVRT
jgi:hypothetical protein